jgi:hypothetical protein
VLELVLAFVSVFPVKLAFAFAFAFTFALKLGLELELAGAVRARGRNLAAVAIRVFLWLFDEVVVLLLASCGGLSLGVVMGMEIGRARAPPVPFCGAPASPGAGAAFEVVEGEMMGARARERAGVDRREGEGEGEDKAHCRESSPGASGGGF